MNTLQYIRQYEYSTMYQALRILNNIYICGTKMSRSTNILNISWHTENTHITCSTNTPQYIMQYEYATIYQAVQIRYNIYVTTYIYATMYHGSTNTLLYIRKSEYATIYHGIRIRYNVTCNTNTLL